MKFYRKMLLAVFSLLLALGLVGIAACGKKAPPEPTPIDYTVTVTCEDENALAGVKVSLKTLAGEAVEGGEEKPLTAGMVTFSALPATYKTVLTGVPETYEWQEATLTEAAPNATVALTKKSVGPVEPAPITYTVTVTCDDENALKGVKVSLKTLAGEAVEGGEEKPLTAGMVTFSALPATYKAVLTGVPETYEWQEPTLTEAAPAATVALTLKKVEPQTATYTVYLNLSAADESAFADVKVGLKTLAGGAVEGGEAKATAVDANFFVYASFEVAPGTYKVVLTGVPENYEWAEATVSDETPAVTISFAHLSEYTVTVTCADENVLANVKVSLHNTLDSSVPAGGEERALSGGTATFRVKAGTYSVRLTGVPATYEWKNLLVSDTSPAVTVPLTLKETDPPATQDHLPEKLTGTVWDSTSNTVTQVSFAGDTVSIDGMQGAGSAEAAEIGLAGSVWTFSITVSMDGGRTVSVAFTYDEEAETLTGVYTNRTYEFTQRREAETLKEFPAALAGTLWTPDHAIAGVSEISFTTESVFIGDGFCKPDAIRLLDGVYTFAVSFTVSGTVSNTLTFTYNAAAGTLTAVNGYDGATLNFTKAEAVDPASFGTVAASIPDETAAELAKAGWSSDDEVVAQVTFEKFAASYGIKVIIYMKNGKGGPVSALIANGDIRKDGTVYQIAYIPKSGTNIRYTVLLRYDTAQKTLTALYSGKTVALKQADVQETPSVYPAALEGTTWINADDPDGTLSGIRSITFTNGEIRWVDADGNTQRVNSASTENGMIWAIVDLLPQGYFCIEYAGDSMTVHTANLGSTSGFTFTKQA